MGVLYRKMACLSAPLLSAAQAAAQWGAGNMPWSMGGVNYEGKAEALKNAHDFFVVCMWYTCTLVFAISALVAVASATRIYIKMNTQGNPEVAKEITTLVGACLFILVGSILFPSLFGYRFTALGAGSWGGM